MINNSIASKLETFPTVTWIVSSPCAFHLKEGITSRTTACILQQLTDSADKDRLYSDLRRLLKDIPGNDMVLILGDFNASVAWKRVLGRHDIGKYKDNGTFCSSSALRTNAASQTQSSTKKISWTQPGCTIGPSIVTFRSTCLRDLKWVLHTRVMPSAKCLTDYYLVCCKLKLQSKPKPKTKSDPVVECLFLDEAKAKFQAALERKLFVDSTPDIMWKNLKSVILKIQMFLGLHRWKTKPVWWKWSGNSRLTRQKSGWSAWPSWFIPPVLQRKLLSTIMLHSTT